MSGYERGEYRRDGLRLVYRAYPSSGGGLPLLCLHGLTRNATDFDDLARWQAPFRPVVAPDLRGRGASEWDGNWRRYHPGTYVEDLLALIEHRQWSRFVLVGTSLGGLLSMMLAQRLPRSVAAVVLNDVGPELAPAGMARIASYAGVASEVRHWNDAAARCHVAFGPALPEFDEADWLRFARRTYREDATGVPREQADPMIGAALREGVGFGFDGWALFAALRDIPTLAIRGALSDLLSPGTFARMAQEKPDLQQLEVPNRGHVPLLDEPACVDGIGRFLERVDAAASA